MLSGSTHDAKRVMHDYDLCAWMQASSERDLHKDDLDPVAEVPTASLPMPSCPDVVCGVLFAFMPSTASMNLRHESKNINVTYAG